MCLICGCCIPITPKWGLLLLSWVCLLIKYQNNSRLETRGREERGDRRERWRRSEEKDERTEDKRTEGLEWIDALAQM